ncbi:MAG: LptF/LptG family permease, partial [Planctomycetes bacterium]|nr:LptF/LptG family permease [Planctomycetota bacterium]
VLAAMAVLPPACFLAFALVGRSCAREGELVAMQGAGRSGLRLALPIFAAAMLIGVASWPWLSGHAPRAYRNYKIESVRLLHHPEVLLPILAEDPTTSYGIPLAFESIENDEMRSVAVVIRREGTALWLIADSAQVTADLKNLSMNLELERGVLDAEFPDSSGAPSFSDASTLSFGSATLRLDGRELLTPEKRLPKARELTNAQATLLARSDELSARFGYDERARTGFGRAPLLRIALSLAIGFLALLGWILGSKKDQSGIGLWIIASGVCAALWIICERSVFDGAHRPLLSNLLTLLVPLLSVAIVVALPEWLRLLLRTKSEQSAEVQA